MTKEELKQEAEKSLDKRLGTYAYIRKQDCYTNYVDGYIDSAEPREKRIAELEATCNKWFEHLKNREEELLNELNNQNEKYNKQIAELEKDFFFYTWCPYDETRSVIRLVTSWGSTEEDVDAILAAIQK
jgi:hypothetical protein